MPNLKPAAARAGFTLIELLVVIALIGVLTGLLVVGIGKLQTSSKRQQTVALLHHCQSLLVGYDAAVHPKFPFVATPCPGPVTVDAGNNGFRFKETVQITQSLFTVMRTVPSCRAGMDKLPPAQLMTNTQLTSFGQNPWTAGVEYSPSDPKNFYSTVQNGSSGYAVYLCFADHIASDGGVQYVTGQVNPGGLQTGQPIPANRPPDTNYWFPYSSDVTARMVVDAWGNPIIACFGALGVEHVPPMPLSGRTSNKDDSNLYANGQSVQVLSPDHRLFFASAGPDGDFGLGDDNLYSFEP